MKKNTASALIGFGLAALSGCGAPILRIPRYLANDPEQLRRYQILKHTYLVMEKPSNKFFKFDSARFAKTVEESLSQTGCHLIGYRVTPALSANDPYVAELSPSSKLNVAFEALNLGSTTGEKEVKRYKGRSEFIEKVPVTNYKLELRVRYEWFVYPSSTPISRGTLAPAVTSELDHPLSEDDREEMLARVMTEAARAVAGQCGIASPGYRERTLLFVEDDADGKKAAGLAANDHCQKAEEIWTARKTAGRGGWRDLFNEAACAERRRDLPNARALYKEAQTAAQNDPDSAKIPWDTIYADIDSEPVMDATLSPAATRWYGHRVAVLPFSDETTSVDGPDVIRNVVFAMFKSGGYNTIPIDEVMETLRNHGFSDAGQFGATTPEKIAQWLKADWLVFGHIEDFNEANIGIYDKRSIAGTLRIWDASTQKEIWSSSIPVKTQQFTLKGNIFGAFLAHIGRAWIEKLRHFPLAAEVIEFTQINFEGFPFQPESDKS